MNLREQTIDCVNDVDPHDFQKTALYMAGIVLNDLDGDLAKSQKAVALCGKLLPVLLAERSGLVPGDEQN